MMIKDDGQYDDDKNLHAGTLVDLAGLMLLVVVVMSLVDHISPVACSCNEFLVAREGLFTTNVVLSWDCGLTLSLLED